MTIVEPTTLVVDSFTTTAALCYGDATGTATVYASGGTKFLTYSYLWSDGQTSSTAIDLAAGTYSVTVTDDNGCTATSLVQVGQPAQALSIYLQETPALCNGSATGEMAAVVGGGTTDATGEYTYLWSNGETTAVISNVLAGTYSVTVTDANGCTITATEVVTESSPLITSTSSTGVTCIGSASGTAEVTVSGGASPYGYLWSNGQVPATASSLVSGTYM